MIKLAMNKSTKNVLIAILPTVLTYTVGKVVRAISKRYHLCPQCATGFKQEVRRMEASASSCEGVELVSSNYRGRKNIQVHQGISRRNIIGTGKIL